MYLLSFADSLSFDGGRIFVFWMFGHFLLCAPLLATCTCTCIFHVFLTNSTNEDTNVCMALLADNYLTKESRNA